MGNHAFLQVRSFGDTYGSLKVKIIESSPVIQTFKVNGAFTGNTVWADGGFLNTPHPIIKS